MKAKIEEEVTHLTLWHVKTNGVKEWDKLYNDITDLVNTVREETVKEAKEWLSKRQMLFNGTNYDFSIESGSEQKYTLSERAIEEFVDAMKAVD